MEELITWRFDHKVRGVRILTVLTGARILGLASHTCESLAAVSLVSLI
jgi:hypothetical protein